MYTVGLYTLGCKVSSYETEAVAEAFVARGYTVRPFSEVCDVYVINTCTVTAESDAKSRKYIRRAIRQNPAAVVAVMGCYSQRAADEVSSIPGVSVVVGTAGKLSLVERVDNILKMRENRARVAESGENSVSFPEISLPDVSVGSLADADFEPMTVTSAPRVRAYVKIEDGCECKCTYCAIAAARGPVRSKKSGEVISEVEGLYRGGTREVVLTGIEVGSYGADLDEGITLADLIEELDRRGSCERIRLGSMAPELLTEKFARRVANSAIFVPHFHISMQSGADATLRRMKRRYSRKMALDNIRLIRSLMPRVMLTADLMVGFPGESEEDFLDTLAFVDEAELLSAHVFAYSRREGTPAANYPDQIPEEIKRERSARLTEHVARSTSLVLDKVIAAGDTLPSILEVCRGGVWSAHSDSYIEIRAKDKKCSQGDLVNIKPLSHENGILYGEIIT